MVLLNLNINHYHLKFSPNSYLDLLILNHKNVFLNYYNQTIMKIIYSQLYTLKINVQMLRLFRRKWSLITASKEYIKS